jgi:hypothetical protein
LLAFHQALCFFLACRQSLEDVVATFFDRDESDLKAIFDTERTNTAKALQKKWDARGKKPNAQTRMMFVDHVPIQADVSCSTHV